ncbi:MAG: HEAT repeat domain-containing protein, partial [Pseudomonadota bacterium]
LPQEAMASGAVGSWLNTQEIRTLLKALLARCRNFDAKETSASNAVCRLFPEKAVGFLLDELIGLDAQESPYARWLWSSLLSLAPHVPRQLSQRLADAPDRALPRLLELVTVSSDKNLAAAVEGLLDHKDDQIRSHAVRTLGNLKAEGSVPGLARIVLYKSWFTGKKMKALQMDAARALADIGTERAKEILRQAVTQGFRELRDLCMELV